MSGRARDNRLVHFTPDQTAPRPGDVVTVTVTRGAPHYLLSDATPLAIRRTRAGDAWAAAAAAPAESAAAVASASESAAAVASASESAAPGAPVLLGMPARLPG
jgi:tRNA-2-methylthio-N6-dimethylallyladenosine synthase